MALIKKINSNGEVNNMNTPSGIVGTMGGRKKR
jgi:hypothetical protein